MTIIFLIIPGLMFFFMIRSALDRRALRIEQRKRLNAQLTLARLIKALEKQSEYDIDYILTEIEEKFQE